MVHSGFQWGMVNRGGKAPQCKSKNSSGNRYVPSTYWLASKRRGGLIRASTAFGSVELQGAWVVREYCRITAVSLRRNPQRAGEVPAELNVANAYRLKKCVGPKGHASVRQELLPPCWKQPITATDVVGCDGLACTRWQSNAVRVPLPHLLPNGADPRR